VVDEPRRGGAEELTRAGRIFFRSRCRLLLRAGRPARMLSLVSREADGQAGKRRQVFSRVDQNNPTTARKVTGGAQQVDQSDRRQLERQLGLRRRQKP